MVANKIIKSPKKRYVIYIGGSVIAIAVVLATLITVGVISQDDIEAWMLLVAGLVPSIVQFVTNILAAVNTDRDEPAGKTAPDPDVYDPKLGGKPKNQI